MKVFTLGYASESFYGWANLGDDIQAVAAKRLLPKVDGTLSAEGSAG